MSDSCSWDWLPAEVAAMVMRNLPRPALWITRMVSKQWYNVSRSAARGRVADDGFVVWPTAAQFQNWCAQERHFELLRWLCDDRVVSIDNVVLHRCVEHDDLWDTFEEFEATIEQSGGVADGVSILLYSAAVAGASDNVQRLMRIEPEINPDWVLTACLLHGRLACVQLLHEWGTHLQPHDAMSSALRSGRKECVEWVDKWLPSSVRLSRTAWAAAAEGGTVWALEWCHRSPRVVDAPPWDSMATTKLTVEQATWLVDTFVQAPDIRLWMLSKAIASANSAELMARVDCCSAYSSTAMTLTTAVTHHAFAVALWYLGTRYRRSTVMTNTHIIHNVFNTWPRQEALSWLHELGATGPNGQLTLWEASTAADVAYGSDDCDSMLAILGLVSESTHQLSPVQRQGLFYRLSPRASAPHYSRLWALVRDCTGERPGGSTVQLCVRNGLDDLLQWTVNAAEMGVATTEMLVLAAERGLIKCAAILILAGAAVDATVSLAATRGHAAFLRWIAQEHECPLSRCECAVALGYDLFAPATYMRIAQD
jgi:hypothetical protein